jgi:hypothetical protein
VRPGHDVRDADTSLTLQTRNHCDSTALKALDIDIALAVVSFAVSLIAEQNRAQGSARVQERSLASAFRWARKNEYTERGWLFVWLRRISVGAWFLLMQAIFFHVVR